MKQKILVRVVCIALSVAILGSVFLVAVSSLSAGAVSESLEDVAAAQIDESSENAAQSPETLKSDFVATVSTNLLKTAYSSPSKGASGYVNDDYVNLRSGAGTNYSVVTCMRKNTKFTYVDGKLYNSNWYKIKLTSNSKTGYIRQDFATLSQTSTDTPSTEKVTGYVNDDYVNLRSGAGTNYSVVTCMRKNTQFTFISTKLYNSNWYNIQLSDGKKGYICKPYATKNSSSSNPSTPTTPTAPTTPSGSIKLSSTSETIYVGNKFAITARGASSVKWSSSNTSVATVDSHGVV
ncbi:MAG: SH3 domain-containing protein, partial [Ruminococcus sp.]|nr:SH3 domain-containing protein [Ruminococcus sp.]